MWKPPNLPEFLRKNNYFVKVVIDSNIVHVEYSNKINVEYAVIEDIYNNTCSLRYHNFLNEHNEIIEKIILPRHIIRWYILLDIFRLCREFNLNYGIVQYFDKDENAGDFVELLNIQIGEEEDKERFLEPYIAVILKNPKRINEFNKIIQEQGLLTSFNILKGLLV